MENRKLKTKFYLFIYSDSKSGAILQDIKACSFPHLQILNIERNNIKSLEKIQSICMPALKQLWAGTLVCSLRSQLCSITEEYAKK